MLYHPLIIIQGGIEENGFSKWKVKIPTLSERKKSEASLAQLVEHPPCKRKVLGPIPRGGTFFSSFFQKSFMNPAIFQRTLRLGGTSFKGLGALLRKSSFQRRGFSAYIMGGKNRLLQQSAINHNKQILSVSSFRLFSTAPQVTPSNTGIYLFGVISTIGMMGGIYYYSNSLKVPLFQ